MNNFNQQQLKAINSSLGNYLIIAGAGSGKTSVLTNRIAYLIDHFHLQANEILAITFTNKAANEMKARLKKISNQNFKWIGTFHSICLKILREDIHYLNRSNNFIILDEEEQISIIKEFMKKNNISSNDYPYKVCISHITKFKHSNLSIDDLVNEKNWKLFNIKNLRQAVDNQRIIKHYLVYCQSNNCLDFNDLLTLTIELFNHEDVRNKWQDKFKYILIDEFQDTNDVQYELIKILSENNQCVFAVGDPDQMIYSWRGANENIIDAFCKDFKNVNLIILNQNYRSTQQILNAANHLIKNNLKRIDKDLFTTKLGNKPIYYCADNQDDESIWVANRINELKEKGYALKDIAILYRNNYQSRNIEEVLFSNDIHYKLYGGVKFYNRKEIKDIIAYLRAIYYHDELFIKRIINTPRRGISTNSIDQIEQYSNEQRISFYEALLAYEKINLTTQAKNAIKEFLKILKDCYNENVLITIDNVLEIAGYKNYLMTNEELDRLNNIDELKIGISKYQQENPNNNFNDYLQDVALYTSNDENKNEDAVSLMTIHIAKGLEFKCVFIIGLNEEIFPSKKSLDMGNSGLEEERRIAYVAITRAKEKLFLSSYLGYNVITHNSNKRSRFVDEISTKFYDAATIQYKRINTSENKQDDWFDSSKSFNSDLQYSNEKNNFKIGDVIIHAIFGKGIVVAMNGETIDVSFNKPHGLKSLIANHKAIRRVVN